MAGFPFIRAIFAGLALAGAPLSSANAGADSVADFYHGKTITIVVGAASGAIYDLTARLMAQYLRAHIPGNPVIIAQNMPGASHVVATEYSFNIAPRDGTSLLAVQSSVILNKLLDPSAKYEPQRFIWIGRAQKLSTVGVVWHTSPIRKFEDALQTPVVFGANSANGPTSIIPWALDRLSGAKIKVIRGYDSQAASFVAMQRGEIEGLGNTAVGDVAQWLSSGEMRALYATGMTRIPSLPEVPTIVETVVRPEDRPAMNLLASLTEIGITLMAPPGVPEERVGALREAFRKMAEDPAFAEGLEKLRFEVDYLPGEKLAQMVRDNLSPSDALLARFKTATAPE